MEQHEVLSSELAFFISHITTSVTRWSVSWHPAEEHLTFEWEPVVPTAVEILGLREHYWSDPELFLDCYISRGCLQEDPWPMVLNIEHAERAEYFIPSSVFISVCWLKGIFTADGLLYRFSEISRHYDPVRLCRALGGRGIRIRMRFIGRVSLMFTRTIQEIVSGG